MSGPRRRPGCDVPWLPHGLDRPRLFPAGWRCSRHTPNAIRGLPEVPPGPGLPAAAWSTPSPQSASAVFDNRAVASGKRRAGEHVYRAAQAAVAKTT